MARRRHPAGNSRIAVAYLRCSTTVQDLSPDAQLAAIRSWASQHDVQVVATHRDIGVSGGTEAARRPGLMAALQAIEAHGAGLMLVSRRDRIARDVIVAATAEKLAEKQGARIVSVDGVSCEQTPEGALMRILLDAFSQYERAVIRSRITAALAVKKSRGEVVGEVPFGYRAEAGRVVACEDEQRTLGRIHELRAAGLSVRAIAAQLNAEGVRPRGRVWHKSTVGVLLTRQAAAGEA